MINIYQHQSTIQFTFFAFYHWKWSIYSSTSTIPIISQPLTVGVLPDRRHAVCGDQVDGGLRGGRWSLFFRLVPAAEKPEIDWIRNGIWEDFFWDTDGIWYKRNYLRNEWDTLTSDLIFKFVMLCLKMGCKPSHMIIRILFEWDVFNEICDAPATLGVPYFQTNPNGGFPMVVKNP